MPSTLTVIRLSGLVKFVLAVYVDVAAYVKQSAAVSGVPIRVSDSPTLLEIARLLVAARAHHAYLPLPANQHRQVG